MCHRPSSLRRLAVAALLAAVAGRLLAAQMPAETLLEPAVLRALDEELSGNLARDHVSRLGEFHRVPASPGFHDAVEYVRGRAIAYGLGDVRVETFPADGKTYFGTLLGNRGWRVDGGELREISPRPRRIIAYDDVWVAVADNSESADVAAPVMDVGTGTSPRDYEGKDVRGKLVLCDGSPAVAHRLAVEERGAVGLISYNSNQRTGWWRDESDLVRWGHLDASGRANTFAVMISVREARQLQQRLASGELITLRATVSARNDDRFPYETLMATIPGSEPASGDVVFSCHLDHQKPGANDNASGCGAILEVARTFRALALAGRLRPPRRTIRFVWPSEMTGTMAYLTKYPELAARIKAAVHLDMVGGDPFVTKSILHITRSPWSAASVTDDVAEIFGRYVIDGAYAGAATGDTARAVRAAGGSKDALWADVTPYESGSDHWVYQEGAFAIPAIYLRDWPDIYIHTNRDRPDNIEPTKIKRAAFIAAASGWYLANLPDNAQVLLAQAYAGAHARLAEDARRAIVRARGENRAPEAENLMAQAVARERRRLLWIERFAPAGLDAGLRATLDSMLAGLDQVGVALRSNLGSGSAPVRGAGARDTRVPARSPAVKGPLGPTSDWVVARAGDAASKLAILRVPDSGDVTYEIVNFIDGRRTVSDIRDAVSAEFEPVEIGAVVEYLELLAKIGAIAFR